MMRNNTLLKGDKSLCTEIVIPKMVIAHLSAALTQSTFSIDIVIHRFIKLLVVTWNLDNTPACLSRRCDCTYSKQAEADHPWRVSLQFSQPLSEPPSLSHHQNSVAQQVGWQQHG